MCVFVCVLAGKQCIERRLSSLQPGLWVWSRATKASCFLCPSFFLWCQMNLHPPLFSCTQLIQSSSHKYALLWHRLQYFIKNKRMGCVIHNNNNNNVRMVWWRHDITTKEADSFLITARLVVFYSSINSLKKDFPVAWNRTLTKPSHCQWSTIIRSDDQFIIGLCLQRGSSYFILLF